MKTTLFAFLSLITLSPAYCQLCFPLGNQTSYGSSNQWKGYVYDNTDFTSYKGYVTEGSSGSPAFDEDFGGDNVTYSTNGCPVNTTTFSVRYKLTKSFSNGFYEFTVGGDDGFRLSLNGGSTWVINRWNDQGYATITYAVQLSGSYNLVLEYYENTGSNRISFNVQASCTGAENTGAYGSGNTWKGYVYDGVNFDIYKGMIQAGNAGSPAFDTDFGGSNASFSTTGCPTVQTETFSVRDRLNRHFGTGQYTFFIGGDDGYRFSIDGGSTWLINRWAEQSYNTTSMPANLTAGNYNLVLEFYENGGDNRLSFYVEAGTILPVRLIDFTGISRNGSNLLNWNTAAGSDATGFEIEKSNDGVRFQSIGIVPVAGDQRSDLVYTYQDNNASGKAYYRLKITSETGAVTYSGIVIVNAAAPRDGELQVFPTILTGTSISLRAARTLNSVEVRLAGANGAMISTKHIARIGEGQSVNLTFGERRLDRGIYLVIVTDEKGLVASRKVIVL